MTLITSSWLVDILLVLFSIYFLLYKYFTRKFDYWKDNNVPFIKPQAFFGNLKEVMLFKKISGEHFADLYNKMKGYRYFGIFIFDKPVLIVRDPELVKNVLVREFNKFADRNLLVDERKQPLPANSLFIIKNPAWKHIRTQLSVAFTSGKLKAMVPLMNEVADDMGDYITKHTLNGESLETKEMCSKYTTDVLASCAFGLNANCFKYEDAEFRKAGRALVEFNVANAIQQPCIFLAPEFAKFFNMKILDQKVVDFLENSFKHTFVEREKGQHRRNDLIDIIIDMKRKSDENFTFDETKMVSQAITFFTAGTETSSATMSFTLYELCMQPHIQNKARNEIISCIKKHGGLTYEATNDMKYLNQCISETLRKYPVLPVLDRLCLEDYQIPGSKYVIEKGTSVYIPLFGLHFDPEYFPKPNEYDPDRFSEERIAEIPGGCYMPFGEGPRICIGMRFALINVKIGLAKIFSEYELLQGEDTPVKINYGKKTVFLVSDVGLPMVYKKLPSVVA